MTFDPVGLQAQIQLDLFANILPFWMVFTPDPLNGGFYGALTNENEVKNDAPRSAVLYGRILWTFSSAYRLYRVMGAYETARIAYDYILAHFIDPENGGAYWSVDAHGQPLDPRKHSYAQAFMIYGLAEYARASAETEPLELAKDLFRKLEDHARDRRYGGYVEGCSRDWGVLEDMRLSDKEPNCRKSMNTLLHVMEAYTNLLRVWDDPELRDALRDLIQMFLQHVICPGADHQDLFFDDDWTVLPERNHISYGHDIEASWLLVEAAEVLGDPILLAKTKEAGLRLAEAVRQTGLSADGAVLDARYPSPLETGHTAPVEYDWWSQAEGVVGFINAFQLSGDSQFAEAAQDVWNYIDQHFVNRESGEWYKVVFTNGKPDRRHFKIGPWECPYHSCRMGFEVLRRLSSIPTE
jgi:mannobiose 2-epimerase